MRTLYKIVGLSLNENFAAILSGSSIGEVLRLGNYIGVSGKIRQFVAFRAGATEVARIKSRREQRVIRHTGFTPIQVDALREARPPLPPRPSVSKGRSSLMQFFGGLVLGGIKTKFCKKIFV